MGVCSTIGGSIVSFLTVYSTPKVVQVHNKKIAGFNRLVQLIILCYVIGFMIIYKQGYQISSPIESAIVTKIKGTIKLQLNESNLNPKFDKNKLPLYNRVWDGQDIVYPPKESQGFFLTTNLVITKDQQLGTCPDDSTSGFCTPDKQPQECLKRQSVLSDGINTGKCVNSILNKGKSVCEVEGWCPTEDENLPYKDNYPIFDEIQNFTVLIKNTIRFPLFNILRRNIDENEETKNGLKCNFSPENPRCPIFKIGDIIKYAGTDFFKIGAYGGVIAIQVNWDCNLDWDLSYCFPTYTFTRLDLADTAVSPGYNFRYSRYNSNNGEEKRDLFKAYGIRFEILTSGKGSKFSIVPLALNIGSGIGLLAIATLVADFALLYFSNRKEVYQTKKYLYVKEDLVKGHSVDAPDQIVNQQ